MNVSPAGRLQNATLLAVMLLAVCAMLAVPFGSARANENSMGTPEEQAACQPEVFRLCREFIPDVPKITACLKREVRSLTPACRAVMTGKPLPRANRPAASAVR